MLLMLPENLAVFSLIVKPSYLLLACLPMQRIVITMRR